MRSGRGRGHNRNVGREKPAVAPPDILNSRVLPPTRLDPYIPVQELRANVVESQKKSREAMRSKK